ncbi:MULTISPECIES: helix-turn-helix domain-containing protein [Pseudomonas]|uniref:helix-turn-helix domain-containing protein n=1 Tax=Pseudomonas putida TaxID=303 RepID=UPI000C14B7CC|nr:MULTISPECIES: helix-turn-helix domain-containing protein [Pseudomonas]MCL8305156.1 helix-turn-helix domain-containing protein [Pseudomonas putida]
MLPLPGIAGYLHPLGPWPWVNAAQRLHVHKQTLVYRVRRIEAISGRSLDNTADVATFWFALQSALAIGCSF